ncbi:MAG: hypothetical protein AB7O98_01785 [Hyphomonadaceae bacterium]
MADDRAEPPSWIKYLATAAVVLILLAIYLVMVLIVTPMDVPKWVDGALLIGFPPSIYLGYAAVQRTPLGRYLYPIAGKIDL